jgi:N-acetyltransferase
MPWLEPVSLSGPHAQLKPLSHDHIDGLVEAVKDGELWKLWYTFIPRPGDMRKEIDRRLGLQAAGSMLPFTVFDADGKIAGMTTYMNVDAPNRRVEIGSTWYAKRVQRSALNTQCKLLLLTHAFEKLDCIAVEFRTHFFNQQSRRGIERLGAKLDGILQPSDRAERNPARYRDLQYHRHRMADGEGAPELSTQRKAAVACRESLR